MATPAADSVTPPPVDHSNNSLTDEFLNGLVQGSSWGFGIGPHVLTFKNPKHERRTGALPTWMPFIQKPVFGSSPTTSGCNYTPDRWA